MDPNLLDLAAYRPAVPPSPETVNESDDVPHIPARHPFPTDALPEPMQSMVRHAARQTNAPESLCGAAGLGIASAAMGSAFRV